MSDNIPYQETDSDFVIQTTNIDDTVKPIEKDFEPPQAGESHVTIWGTTQSGKTVYLAMLFNAFQKAIAEDDWRLFAEGDETVTWIKNIYSRMIQNGIFPPATEVGKHYFPRFKFQKDRHELKMIFADASGEMYEDIEEYVRQYKIHDPMAYLRACKGILFLLDPVRVLREGNNTFFTPLIDTILKLLKDENGNIGVIKKPIVFCMTKCDDPDLRHLLHRPELVEQEASRIFGEALMGPIHNYMPNAKWFACSALGYHEDEPVNVMSRWDGRLGITNPKKVNPINVREAFEYLLNQLVS